MRDENLRLPVRPAAIRACSAFFLAASLVFLPLACSKTNQPASPPAMQPASKPGPAPTDRIGIHWGQPAEGPFIMGLGSTGSNNAVIALKNQSEMYRSIAAYMMTRERDSKELIPAKEVQFFLVDSQGRDVPRLNQFTACIDGCSQYLAPGNAIIYSFDIRQMFKLNSNGVYRLKACFDPSGYYESTTRPEILSSGTLTIGVDLAGPPIPYEGHKLLKASEWIGLPDSQPAAPPVTQRVDGKSLLDQAAKIRSQHPAGGLEMWQALAELVKPGMTVRQMKLILPPYPSVLNREGKNATLEYPELLELHGNLFIIQYWLALQRNFLWHDAASQLIQLDAKSA
ncbi:MAG: hypothetical protein HZA50_13490 [Planctomycetes bacterium]|nr:hypothetical protein [Planctomycetota bacterium]